MRSYASVICVLPLDRRLIVVLGIVSPILCYFWGDVPARARGFGGLPALATASCLRFLAGCEWFYDLIWKL